MRRVLSVLIPLLLLATLSAGTSLAVDTPDEQFHWTSAPSSTAVGAVFSDTTFFGAPSRLVTNLQTLDSNGKMNNYDQRLCTSVDDALCHSGNYINYLSHLPKCENASDTDCVDSVFALKPDGGRVDGEFLRGMPEKLPNPFTGNTSLGIPRPGLDSIWTIPSITNGGGTDTYVVSAVFFGNANKLPDAALSKPVPLLMFNATILPVTLVSGTFQPSHVESSIDAVGIHHVQEYGPGGSCIIASTSECAMAQAFPSDVTFGFSLRLSQQLAGWLHGRMRDPVIDYSADSSGTRLTVQGLPVKVPIVLGWAERSQLPSVIPGMTNPVSGTLQGTIPWGDTSINLLQIWLPLVQNKSAANPSEWVIRMLRSDEMAGADVCMRDSKTLAGVVATNSTVYSAGPPTFNSATQSLDYTLVSPHWTRSGEVFKGVYTLAIRSDVARCLYKFSSAPIKATISVTDDAGQSSVAIESMSEHDGWIYLSASNFEFSSPTVHVRFSQDVPVAKPIVSPSPSPILTTKPQGKKVTITCVRGKVSKRVTTDAPKCPPGFKKKSKP